MASYTANEIISSRERFGSSAAGCEGVRKRKRESLSEEDMAQYSGSHKGKIHEISMFRNDCKSVSKGRYEDKYKSSYYSSEDKNLSDDGNNDWSKDENLSSNDSHYDTNEDESLTNDDSYHVLPSRKKGKYSVRETTGNFSSKKLSSPTLKQKAPSRGNSASKRPLKQQLSSSEEYSSNDSYSDVESTSGGNREKDDLWHRDIIQSGFKFGATSHSDPQMSSSSEASYTSQEGDEDGDSQTHEHSQRKQVVAIDCEFVSCRPNGKWSNRRTGKRKNKEPSEVSVAAHCAIVDYNYKTIYNSHIRPELEVSNRRGMSEWDLKNGTPFSEAREEILGLLKGKLVVANDIRHDLKSLQICLGGDIPVSSIRDTSICEELRKQADIPSTYPNASLKDLAKGILGCKIQKKKPHDPEEDARVAMKLYRRVEEQPDWEGDLKRRSTSTLKLDWAYRREILKRILAKRRNRTAAGVTSGTQI